MTAQTIVFDTEETFTAWHAGVNALLGYPNPDTLTTQYTSVELREDGKWHAPIDPSCPEVMLVGEVVV